MNAVQSSIRSDSVSLLIYEEHGKEYCDKMETPEVKTPVKRANRIAKWIIWGMCLYSVIIYVHIANTMNQSQIKISPSVDMMTIVLAVASGFLTLIIFFSKRLFGKRVRFLVFSIIRWALSLSIGVYGLTLYLIGASFNIMYVFTGWSCVLLLVMIPLRKAEDSFLKYKESVMGK